MILQFEGRLSQSEVELLLKAPVLLSILASSADHEISEDQKADAIKMSHLKTFTAHPDLIPYYQEVEKHFKKYFQETVKKYAPLDVAKREELKNEIEILNLTIAKLEKYFAAKLHKSLIGYAEHVKKANKTILENFVFPIPIHGLTD